MMSEREKRLEALAQFIIDAANDKSTSIVIPPELYLMAQQALAPTGGSNGR